MNSKLLSILILACTYTTVGSIQAVTGNDIAGGVLKGLRSGVSLLVFSQYMENLQPALKKTEANLKFAVDELKKDARFFVDAHKKNNEQVKLLASKKFLSDMARMQAIGNFLEYIVDAFDHLARAVEPIPGGASGKITSLANQIENYKKEMSVVWKMSALMAQSMDTNCAVGSPVSKSSSSSPSVRSQIDPVSNVSEKEAEAQLEELAF